MFGFEQLVKYLDNSVIEKILLNEKSLTRELEHVLIKHAIDTRLYEKISLKIFKPKRIIDICCSYGHGIKKTKIRQYLSYVSKTDEKLFFDHLVSYSYFPYPNVKLDDVFIALVKALIKKQTQETTGVLFLEDCSVIQKYRNNILRILNIKSKKEFEFWIGDNKLNNKDNKQISFDIEFRKSDDSMSFVKRMIEQNIRFNVTVIGKDVSEYSYDEISEILNTFDEINFMRKRNVSRLINKLLELKFEKADDKELELFEIYKFRKTLAEKLERKHDLNVIRPMKKI